ncbi:hypothetical protein GCM10007938_01080 [Vibrio zhanjiangensis]|uniref:Uncharacterized protein n=1 Tax=Vibrio zhanjiangensis TaxID=1046128 RepID=A0ABQ6EUV7_9VIBR|nr:hypothetical protein GCM10007938_01080 [Vibrio zhanjiangensis]
MFGHTKVTAKNQHAFRIKNLKISVLDLARNLDTPESGLVDEFVLDQKRP